MRVYFFVLMLCASLIAEGTLKSSKHKTTYFTIELLREALTEFHKDIGRYPTTKEGLDALSENTSNIEDWKGPYLKKKLPKDPWGEEYVYIFPSKYGTKQYDLYSKGKNQKDDVGGKDDISNWSGFNDDIYKTSRTGYESSIIGIVVFSLGAIMYRITRRSSRHAKSARG